MNKLTSEDMAILEARRLKALERSNEIDMYWHCKKCLNEDLPQRIGVGWTAKGVQVWCETHNENVRHIDFLGQQVGIVDVKEVA